ncbi:MAG: TrmO family methyltransferase, partial [archaeon]
MSGNVKVEFSPIGVVKRELSDEEEKEAGRKSPVVIQVFPEFQEALEGLDGFSHIFVLSYLDRLRPEQKNHLKIQPRRSLLLKTGLRIEEIPLVGVFAIDTPGRPNPIG